MLSPRAVLLVVLRPGRLVVVLLACLVNHEELHGLKRPGCRLG